MKIVDVDYLLSDQLLWLPFEDQSVTSEECLTILDDIVDLLWVPSLRPLEICLTDSHCKHEFRALAVIRWNSNLAAQYIDYFLADVESQSYSIYIELLAIIYIPKACKQFVQLLLLNANTSISHLNLQIVIWIIKQIQIILWVEERSSYFNTDVDGALGSKLECITLQVKYYLLNPLHIWFHYRTEEFTNIVVDIWIGVVVNVFVFYVQIDILCLGLIFLDTDDLIDGISDIEFLNIFSKMALLDLCVIKQILYQKWHDFAGRVLNFCAVL